jgi:thiamine transport system ATP-binding protein
MTLEVEGLVAGYGDVIVIDGFDLRVEPGQIVALQGPSGSGKSTLLSVIAGILAPIAGHIRVDGQEITHQPAHHRRIAMVFQDNQLFPHRNVAGNIAFGPQMNKLPKSEQQRIVSELLQVIGLPDFGARRIDELSGGEAKRIAVARALAAQPRLLLLDEPLTGLDTELHDRLATELVAIITRAGIGAIWVTHDRAEAQLVADRVIELDQPQQGQAPPSSS